MTEVRSLAQAPTVLRALPAASASAFQDQSSRRVLAHALAQRFAPASSDICPLLLITTRFPRHAAPSKEAKPARRGLFSVLCSLFFVLRGVEQSGSSSGS
jgi:hypothetical protein